GEPTEKIRHILDFLLQLQNGLRAAKNAASSLDKCGVVVPWALKLEDGENQSSVVGLYKVDEEKLMNLSDEDFVGLRRQGALALAYTQLLSMGKIETLAKLVQVHANHVARTEKQQEEIKSMFVADRVEDEIDWDAMLKDDES